jgi:hypothetical protein
LDVLDNKFNAISNTSLNKWVQGWQAKSEKTFYKTGAAQPPFCADTLTEGNLLL